MCGMSQSSVLHHSFIRAAWLIGRCQVPHSQVSHENSFLCVAGLIGMCGGRADWYVWHVAVIYVAALIDMCGLSQSSMWQDSLVCVACRSHVCCISHSCVSPTTFSSVMSHTCHIIRVMSHETRHVTSDASYHAYIRATRLNHMYGLLKCVT